MTYKEIEEAGRRLSERQVNDQVRELARDPRFAAMAEWLRRNGEAWAQTVGSQGLAESHGKLAHAAGSLHAVEILRAQLCAIVERTQKRSGGEMSPGPRDEG